MSEFFKLSETGIKFKKSGIYKLNFPNGKYYIGLSFDIRERIKAHNRTAFNKNDPSYNLPVYRAIRKYGTFDEVEILEVLPRNENILNEREIYWINYYNTTNKENGYNVSPGGHMSGRPGIENYQASINSEKDLEKIYNLITDSKYSFNEIAEMFKTTPAVISAINTGRNYFNEKYTYPLRSEEKIAQVRYEKRKDKLNFLSDEVLEQLTQDLLNTTILQKDLAKKYQIGYSMVNAINEGKAYYRDYLDYPLRKQPYNLRITDNVLDNIIYDLKNSTLKIKDIAKKYNLSRETVSRINHGKRYKKDSEDYPIRKNKLWGKFPR